MTFNTFVSFIEYSYKILHVLSALCSGIYDAMKKVLKLLFEEIIGILSLIVIFENI